MWQSGIDMKVPYNLMLRTLVIYVVFEGDLYLKLGIIAVHKAKWSRHESSIQSNVKDFGYLRCF